MKEVAPADTTNSASDPHQHPLSGQGLRTRRHQGVDHIRYFPFALDCSRLVIQASDMAGPRRPAELAILALMVAAWVDTTEPDVAERPRTTLSSEAGATTEADSDGVVYDE